MGGHRAWGEIRPFEETNIGPIRVSTNELNRELEEIEKRSDFLSNEVINQVKLSSFISLYKSFMLP